MPLSTHSNGFGMYPVTFTVDGNTITATKRTEDGADWIFPSEQNTTDLYLYRHFGGSGTGWPVNDWSDNVTLTLVLQGETETRTYEGSNYWSIPRYGPDTPTHQIAATGGNANSALNTEWTYIGSSGGSTGDSSGQTSPQITMGADASAALFQALMAEGASNYTWDIDNDILSIDITIPYDKTSVEGRQVRIEATMPTRTFDQEGGNVESLYGYSVASDRNLMVAAAKGEGIQVFRIDSGDRVGPPIPTNGTELQYCDVIEYDGSSGDTSNSIAVAVGSPTQDTVYVFQWTPSRNNWTRLGSAITGQRSGDYFGHSVSLLRPERDANGQVSVSSYQNLTLAVGAPHGTSLAGYTQVYEFYGGAWRSKGSPIPGDANSQSGFSVSIGQGARSGNEVLVIGEPGLDRAQVYMYNGGGEWILEYFVSTERRTNTVTGPAGSDFGYHVSLDQLSSPHDSVKFAVGAPSEGNGTVKVYQRAPFNGWGEVGSLTGDQADSKFGFSVSLRTNDEGICFLAVGSPHHHGNVGAEVQGAETGSFVGRVQVYEYSPTTAEHWLQFGSSIHGVHALRGDGTRVAERFGHGVAISGNLVIGGSAYFVQEGETGTGRGRVTIWELNNDTTIEKDAGEPCFLLRFSNSFFGTTNPRRADVRMIVADNYRGEEQYGGAILSDYPHPSTWYVVALKNLVSSTIPGTVYETTAYLNSLATDFDFTEDHIKFTFAVANTQYGVVAYNSSGDGYYNLKIYAIEE